MSVINLIRENIRNLKPYSSARDEFDSSSAEMVFLDANENPFNTVVNRYPDPYQNNVKALLAQQKRTSSDNMLLGNGSDEVLDLIFRAFCEPGKDNIITLPPTYGMYGVLAGVNNVEIQEVPLLEKSFEPDVERILKVANNNTKLLFLCSPNNPTGNSFSAESISTLLKAFNGIVVIDEAYIDFSSESSWITRLDEYDNLIVTQTLSKAYGMAGIRLGVCYASKEIITVLNKIKPPYNVNTLTQEKALSRLKNIDEVQSEITNIIIERNRLSVALKSIDCVEQVYESDANFILARVDDANLRYNQLLEKGIVVRNRSKQLLCDNCLRFTVGTAKENTTLINTLKTL